MTKSWSNDEKVDRIQQMNSGGTHGLAKQVPNRSALNWPGAIRTLLFGAFLIQATVVCSPTRLGQAVEEVPWPAELSIGLAAATTMATLTGELPAQNVLLASALIALIGAAGGTFDKLASVELMGRVYKSGGGGTSPPLGFWTTPVMWLVMVLNARSVAKLLWQRCRRSPNYGSYVLAGTVLLVLALELSALATVTNRRWTGQALQQNTGHLERIHLVVWTLLGISTVPLVTPILINKSPMERASSARPLAVWLTINLLVLLNPALQGFWWADGMIAVTLLLGIFVYMERRKLRNPPPGAATEPKSSSGTSINVAARD